MIRFTHTGDFKKIDQFLMRNIPSLYRRKLEKYALQGVQALAAATPIKTGKTASSWSYDIIQNEDEISIVWKNSNINKYVNVAIILQYGHGTRNGGYAQGIDYINPALQPLFDKMADAAWKEVIDYR